MHFTTIRNVSGRRLQDTNSSPKLVSDVIRKTEISTSGKIIESVWSTTNRSTGTQRNKGLTSANLHFIQAAVIKANPTWVAGEHATVWSPAAPHNKAHRVRRKQKCCECWCGDVAKLEQTICKHIHQQDDEINLCAETLVLVLSPTVHNDNFTTGSHTRPDTTSAVRWTKKWTSGAYHRPRWKEMTRHWIFKQHVRRSLDECQSISAEFLGFRSNLKWPENRRVLKIPAGALSWLTVSPGSGCLAISQHRNRDKSEASTTPQKHKKLVCPAFRWSLHISWPDGSDSKQLDCFSFIKSPFPCVGCLGAH